MASLPDDTSPRNMERDRYAGVIVSFLPACCGRELELRCSLMLTRDRATAAKLREPSPAAWACYSLIESVVTTEGYASMPIDRLEAVRAAVLRLGGIGVELENHGA